MRVRIPDPLRSYTEHQSVVDADGNTVAELLADLDDRYPGIRFRMVDEQNRIRKHMKVFVNDESVRDLDTAITDRDEIDRCVMGEDWENCLLIAVQSPIEYSRFVSVGVNLAVALCPTDTLAGVLLSRLSRVVSARCRTAPHRAPGPAWPECPMARRQTSSPPR